MASSLSPLSCLHRIPTARHFVVSTTKAILGTTNIVLKHATSKHVSATTTLGRHNTNNNNNNKSSITKSFGSRHKLVPGCFNQQQQHHNSYYRFYSAPTTHHHEPFDDTTPQGDLFEAVRDNDNKNNNTNDDDNNNVFLHHSSPCSSWVGQSGRIKRTFGAQANADAMLLCGGAALAAHASFDPHYARAATWIHNHAVGPAVLSPVLTSGLLTTLTQAAFPQSVPLSQSMQQIRPLVVGVSVYATITVQRVTSRVRGGSSSGSSGETSPDDDKDANGTLAAASVRDAYAQQGGYQIDLQAVVSRVRDEVVISQGTVSIWLADLQHHHNADHAV